MKDKVAIEEGWIKRTWELMEENGITTYTELSELTNLSVGSLNMSMRGMHSPRQKTLDKIADALNTTTQYLLYGKNKAQLRDIPIIKDINGLIKWVSESDIETSFYDWYCSADRRLSANAFALEFNRNDMEPVFNKGDLIIFETVPNGDPSLLNGNFQKKESLMVLAIEHNTRWVFGRYSDTHEGEVIERMNHAFPPVVLGQHHKIIGVCVGQFRDWFSIS